MDIDALEEHLSRQRAVRAFDTSRNVDDALVERMLRIATLAPNGGNRQLWRFIVIRDPEAKEKLATLYEEQARAYLGRAPEGQTSWRDVPVLIAACSEPFGGGASIFPAVQNLLLAAQTLGLGSVLTTLWKAREAEVKAILGVPDEIELHAIMPVGWPDRRHGRSRRRPVAEVTYRDRYGRAW